MNHHSFSRPRLRAFTAPLLGVVATLAFALVFACGTTPAESQAHDATRGALATAPVLGSAQSFAVLGGTTVTNTNATTITGDLGVDPGLAITGFPPGIVIGGSTHAGDALALQAQSDVTAAYGVLAGEACDTDLTGTDLGGLTLAPGVYCFSSSAQLTGALVLDAGGHADAVFVFQIVSTLTTASNASVQVINGGGACGVFWQVGSSATIGTGTSFTGSILALTSISLATSATVSGRALARNGEVTMDLNVVSVGTCGSAASDAGTDAASDAAGNDAASADAGSNDAASADAAPADGSTSDGSTSDGGQTNMGDAGPTDASPADTGANDAGIGHGPS